MTKLQDVITYKGQKVYPSELEGILTSHPAVIDAAIIGVPAPKEGHDDQAGEVPCGFVVAAPSSKQGTPTVTVKELLDFASQKPGDYKDLKWDIEIIEAIPRSPAGKVLRRELQKMADN